MADSWLFLIEWGSVLVAAAHHTLTIPNILPEVQILVDLWVIVVDWGRGNGNHAGWWHPPQPRVA